MRITLLLLSLLLNSCSSFSFSQRMYLANMLNAVTDRILGVNDKSYAGQTSYSFTIDGKDYYPDDSGYVVLPVMEYRGK